MIKNNSTDTAPKGRIPPIKHVIIGCMYQACTGILLGIWFVRVGKVTVSLLYPKNDPKRTKGTETQNHKNSRVKNVSNEIAPEEPSAHNTKFNKKNIPNITLGYKNAVNKVFCFHSVPLNILNNLEDEYPAKEPINTKSKINAVPRDPRFAGESKPPRANTRVARNIKHNWTPDPTKTLNGR